MSPEVLIYIQSVKTFFEKNDVARKYFLEFIDEDVFFKYLGEISQKNFEKDGEVSLTLEQFEHLRKSLMTLTKYTDIKKSAFIDFGDYGHICLN
jgi:hypothetical protein